MERTLTLETCALKATNRQWNRLSPEVQRMINMRTLFVHRTAPLIKDLEFTRRPEAGNGAYRRARLQVASSCAPFIRHLFWTHRIVLARCICYDLPDFGDAE